MHVVTADQAPVFELPGVVFTGGAAPSRGSAGLCTWRITVAAGHDSPEPHTIDTDEVFTVLSGAIRLGADQPVLTAGDVAIVPAGHPIQLSNPEAEPAQAVVAIRAGFTGRAADGTVITTIPWAR